MTGNSVQIDGYFITRPEVHEWLLHAALSIFDFRNFYFYLFQRPLCLLKLDGRLVNENDA